MKRFLGIAIFFIFILVGVCFYGYFNRTKIASYILTRTFQVHSSIASIDLNFKDANSTIHHLKIDNPKEAKEPTALKIEKIKTKVSYFNYFKNPIDIDEIHVDNIYVNIEIYNKERTESNWNTLLSSMTIDHEEDSLIQRTVKIKTLLFTNIHIHIILSDGKSYDLESIKYLEFRNVSSEKGFPIHELTEVITKKLIEAIFKSAGISLIYKVPKAIIKGIVPFFP